MTCSAMIMLICVRAGVHPRFFGYLPRYFLHDFTVSFPTFVSFLLFVFFCAFVMYVMCICAGMSCACHGPYVEVRGQFGGVEPFFPC